MRAFKHLRDEMGYARLLRGAATQTLGENGAISLAVCSRRLAGSAAHHALPTYHAYAMPLR